MKLLLVADLDDWILGQLAQRLAQVLDGQSEVTVLVSQSPDFAATFAALQASHDVVHFLSPWDFYALADQVRLPCAVTLWHAVQWAPLEQHAWRIDTLCVGAEQWRRQVAGHVPPGLPVHRMPYGLDTQQFRRILTARAGFIQQHGLPADVLVLGFAGKASSNEGNRKGLDRLWRCLTHLQSTTALPFVLRISGKGWNMAMVPAELRARVFLAGYMDSRLVPDFYSSLDYYVCTSRIEGVPYPVLEAMSCECVVLSTPVGVVPEILTEGETGFLLQETAIERDFVRAIEGTRDRDRRATVGAVARQRVVAGFDWQTAVAPARYQEIYQSAINFYQQRPALARARIHLRSYMHDTRRQLRRRLRRRKGATVPR